MKLKPTHFKLLGSTQRGKTKYANSRHRKFPRISIFVDLKGVDRLWGAKIRTLQNLAHLVLLGPKLVYDPPRLPTGLDFERVRADLTAFWMKVQDVARRTNASSDDIWIEFIVDEAQVLEQDEVCRQILSDMAARALGMGMILGYITQYPAGLQPITRSNLDTLVLYGLNDEGLRCIRNWGWPLDEPLPIPRDYKPDPEKGLPAFEGGMATLRAWITLPYHFATYHPVLGWRLHPPIPLD